MMFNASMAEALVSKTPPEPHTTLEPQTTLNALVPDWPQQTLLPQSTAEPFTSEPLELS